VVATPAIAIRLARDELICSLKNGLYSRRATRFLSKPPLKIKRLAELLNISQQFIA
jgi:hypothetical protein